MTAASEMATTMELAATKKRTQWLEECVYRLVTGSWRDRPDVLRKATERADYELLVLSDLLRRRDDSQPVEPLVAACIADMLDDVRTKLDIAKELDAEQTRAARGKGGAS